VADGTLGFKSFPGATKTVFDRTHLAFAAGGTNGASFCRSADETALAGHALSIEISSGSTSHIVRCTKPSTDGLRVGCAGAAGTTEQQQQSQCSPHGSHGVTSTTPGTNGGIGRPSYYTQRRVSKRVTLYSHCIQGPPVLQCTEVCSECQSGQDKSAKIPGFVIDALSFFLVGFQVVLSLIKST
jgi:hypothetical protein